VTQAIMAFLEANWPYFAAGFLLLWAWMIWEINHAPELPWHD